MSKLDIEQAYRNEFALGHGKWFSMALCEFISQREGEEYPLFELNQSFRKEINMLHNFLKRAKNEMLRLQFDCMTELQKSKGFLKGTYTVAAVTTSTLLPAVVAFADPTGTTGTGSIQGFGQSVTSIITDIYTTSFSIVTVLAAVLLVIAFITRMTANTQKAAQATSWIVRIIVCYIAINCIGLLFSVIDGTIGSYNYNAGS